MPDRKERREIECHETQSGNFNRHVYLVNLKPIITLTSSDRFHAVKDGIGTNEDVLIPRFVCITCNRCTEQVDVS